MLPFSLYATAGVLTAAHLYWLLALGPSAPVANLLEGVALAGSLCLLAAAGISLFKPRLAGQIALVACLLIWVFYAPATVSAVQTKLLKQPVAVPHSVPTHH